MVFKQELPKLDKTESIMLIHPEWLFNRGRINPRGPYYDVLKYILDVDHELETLQIKKKAKVKIAHNIQEYEKNIAATQAFMEKLSERGVDIFLLLKENGAAQHLKRLALG